YGGLDRRLTAEVEVLEADVLVDEVHFDEIVFDAIEAEEEVAILTRLRWRCQRLGADGGEGVVDQAHPGGQARRRRVGRCQRDAVAADDRAPGVPEPLALHAAVVEMIVLPE